MCYTERTGPRPAQTLFHWKGKTALKPICKLQERLTPPPAWRWLALTGAGLGSGLAWALVAQLIEKQSVSAALACVASLSLWLSALFLGLAVLTLALLTGSLFAANLVVGLVSVVLSFVNHFKVLITSVPFNISDLSLAGKVANIATLNRESLVLSRACWLAIAASVLWLAVAALLSRPLRLRWRRSAPAALVPALVFVLVFIAGAGPLVYEPLRADLDLTISQTASNHSCGFVLGLWRSALKWNESAFGEDYSQESMDQVLEQIGGYVSGEETGAGEDHPHIIFILSESFFDVTTLEGVSYAADPIPEFHALQSEGVSGTFYTRSLGYGTCNIELEIFTGINTGLLSGEDLYTLDADVFARLPSVLSVLAEQGYYTSMLHTFNDSIYNRSAFLPYLGFTDVFFSDGFAAFYEPAAQAEDYWDYMDSRISGQFYSDDLLTDLLIAQFEEQTALSDGPVFLYGASMENHSPYTGGKYAQDEITVEVDSALTGEAAESLLALSQGVSNASAALGKLTDYFRDCDESVVIVFYGDHRPGLGLSNGGSVYSELGMVGQSSQWTLEDYAQLYSTSYLIWSNDPDCLPAPAGTTGDTSSNYLGSVLLDLAGVEQPLYWQLIGRLAQERTIDTAAYHRSASGQLSDSLPAEGETAQGLALLADVLRDAIYGQQYITRQVGE